MGTTQISKIKKQQAEELFIDIAESETECEEIIEQIRSLRSNNDLDDEQYDYIIENWDKLLEKHNL